MKIIMTMMERERVVSVAGVVPNRKLAGFGPYPPTIILFNVQQLGKL